MIKINEYAKTKGVLKNDAFAKMLKTRAFSGKDMLDGERNPMAGDLLGDISKLTKKISNNNRPLKDFSMQGYGC